MDALTSRIEALAGAPVTGSRPLTGGDVSEVRAVDLADGRALVAKVGGPVASEARMLRSIRASGCPAPEVIGVAGDLLLMTRLPEGRSTPQGWAEAGEAVATLHAAHGSAYGWPEDHAIGPAPQPGGETDDWPTFWAEKRLLAWPEVLPRDVADRLHTLAKRLPDLIPAQPPKSLLHGDLWTGNLLFDGGFSGLIDPASYHGDSEVDLAALTTFGTPPPQFWEGYGPLREG